VFFSVTAVSAPKFAKSTGRKGAPFAEEYMIWAANESCKETGGNFAKATRGLTTLGICRDDLMLFGDKEDVNRQPSKAARADAKKQANRWQVQYLSATDLKDPHWTFAKQTLFAGHPLAAAFRWPEEVKDAAILKVPQGIEKRGVHAVVLAGYTDDASKPGGGVFHFRNSWGTGWGKSGYGVLSYAFAHAAVTDALWLKYGAPDSEKALFRFEAEKLPVAKAHLCEVTKQDMQPFNKNLWSAGHQLFAKAKKGAVLELQFNVTDSGTYRLRVLATRAGDYGKIQFALDGGKVGQVYDQYCSDGVYPSSPRALGTHSLQAGTHTLRVTVVDKHAESGGYFFGLDTLDLCAP
jgi:Papain family cysteine protease